MQPQTTPIGYLLKKADKLLTEKIDQLQLAFGLTRLSWQVLNSIRERGIRSQADLIGLLEPFAETSILEELLLKLCNDHIIESDGDGSIHLTEKGKKLHDDCLVAQKEFRQKSMKDISGQDYETAVSTLQQMIKNISQP